MLELRFPDEVRAALDGRLNGIGDRIEMLPDRVQVYTIDGERALQEVHARALPLESAVVRRSTLEDVFLRITGESADRMNVSAAERGGAG